MSNIFKHLMLVGGVLLLGTGGAFAAEAMRLHGAATVAKGIIEPSLDAIESDAGLALTMVVNGSGNGLQDLAAGRADIAMISAPLEIETKTVNSKSPGALDPSAFKVFPVGTAQIVFIVHPASPVRTLSAAQLREVFSGEIRNWSQLGGPDRPIAVTVETQGNGTRAVVEDQLTKGTPFAAEARIVPALKEVATAVSQDPGAIGYGNAASIDRDAVKVVDGPVLLQPLSLVTKGPPTAAMEKVIAAVAAAGGQ